MPLAQLQVAAGCMETPTHDLEAGTAGNASEIPIATQDNLDSLAIELHDQACRCFIYGLEQDCADSELTFMKRIRALQRRLQVLKDSKLLLKEAKKDFEAESRTSSGSESFLEVTLEENAAGMRHQQDQVRDKLLKKWEPQLSRVSSNHTLCLNERANDF